MANKKSINRYTVAIDEGIVSVNISQDDFEEEKKLLKDKLSKLNDKSKDGYLYGNIRRVNNHTISYHKYRKISNTTSLQAIDIATTKLNDENHLRQSNKIESIGKIVIVYRASGEVRTLPVIYSDNKYLLNRENLRSEYQSFANDIELLNLLTYNKKIAASVVPCAGDEFDKLKSFTLRMNDYIKGCERRNEEPYITGAESLMDDFFRRFTAFNGSINYLNLRTLSNLMIEYKEKKKEDKEKQEQEQVEMVEIKEPELKLYNQLNLFTDFNLK